MELKLPETFTSGGFDMRLVQRRGDLAIYAQCRKDKIVSYEVVKIAHKPTRRLPDGSVAPPCEAYPSPSEWGRTAWTCVSIERAQERLAGLLERSNSSILNRSEGKDSGGVVAGE
jgi:hypothetical protein